jgi:succinate-semialdehyde dehydrogenase/glutarate-semialdehyde dehydrogenase
METTDVKNPATGAVLNQIPSFDPRQMSDVVAKARKAQSSWASKTYRERASFLKRGKEFLNQNIDRAAKIISENNG